MEIDDTTLSRPVKLLENRLRFGNDQCRRAGSEYEADEDDDDDVFETTRDFVVDQASF